MLINYCVRRSISENIVNNGVKYVEENYMKSELQMVIEENEGLRKGLQEISEILKDNSKQNSYHIFLLINIKSWSYYTFYTGSIRNYKSSTNK